ncbi:hypothetical protein KQX64_06960 [Rhodopseudomonas palustris]|nr:hypothetical protein KQX64_06960 [Rhodopseudomonas palustris]
MKLARPFLKWTAERAARAGFLAGRGWSRDEIAADEILGATTPKALEHMLRRWKIPLMKTRGGKCVLCALSPSETERLEAAARARSMSLEMLAEELLSIVAGDAALIENILDDEA